MGKWKYRKPEHKTIQGICEACKMYKQAKHVKGTFGALCCKCKREQKKDFLYRKSKKEVCEKCGFIPEHSCQLDVDHIDGNKKNTEPANLQTLCANCHRLKTRLNKDYINKA